MSVGDVILSLGAQTRLSREQKMTTSEIGLFVSMAIACILWAIVSYSIGYKEGHKEGYQRGRAVTRHISAKAVAK